MMIDDNNHMINTHPLITILSKLTPGASKTVGRFHTRVFSSTPLITIMIIIAITMIIIII